MIIKRKLKSLIHPFLKNHVTIYRSGLEKGIKVKGKIVFLQAFKKTSKEDKFLQELKLNNMVIYDIGGFDGIMTIFFSRKTGTKGKVITFEPNPKSCKIILENLKINNVRNVVLRQIGLGAKNEIKTFVIRKHMPATGTAQDDLKAEILKEKEVDIMELEIDTLDNQISVYKLPRPDFVKIDVEGLELDVLSGMNKAILDYKPKLFIEIHGANNSKKVENIKDIVYFLKSYNYDIFHIETEKNINFTNSPVAKEGHIYCV